MLSIFKRLLNFDRLIGPVLVKLVYYVGAIVIVLGAVGAFLAAVFSLFGGNFGPGLMQLIAVPAVAAVGFVYWRFLCELFMLAFLAYERLGQVRDLMRIAAGQAPPATESDETAPSF
ncbi:MAG: DUF4282 domain-containing protein [Hyphomonadaceae bacterium]|nr:DUF4282 domain-containing protein [Hyphomonadaceae bacterium]